MNFSEVQIERLVHEVIERLKNSAKLEPPTSASPPNSDSKLQLRSRLITLEALEGKLRGIHNLEAPAGTVITPAARDYLREQGVQLTATNGAVEREAAAASLVIGVAETNYCPANLSRALRKQGVDVERVANTGMIMVIDELADQVVLGGRLGLLLTEQSAAALCLANRRRGVRAALATSVTAVEHAARSVGANLLVMEPSGRGLHELRQTVMKFCSIGPANCPERLRERLS